jgi:hypothetical protein
VPSNDAHGAPIACELIGPLRYYIVQRAGGHDRVTELAAEGCRISTQCRERDVTFRFGPFGIYDRGLRDTHGLAKLSRC